MRRILITAIVYGILGALTSVAVAWGLTIHDNATQGLFNYYSLSPLHPFVTEHDGQAKVSDGELRWALRNLVRVDDKGRRRRYTRDDLPWWSLLRDPPENDSATILEFAAGWPLPCLRWVSLSRARDVRLLRPEIIPARRSIDGELGLASIGAGLNEVHRLPVGPIWFNLVLDSIVFAVVWLILLRAPALWKVNLWLRRRAKNRCGWCGYQTRGGTNRRCPECGHEHAERPYGFFQPRPNTAIGMSVLLVAMLASIGVYMRSQPQVPEILAALFESDHVRLRQAIARGEDPEALIPLRFGTVHPVAFAMDLGDVESARILLEGGVDATLVGGMWSVPSENPDAWRENIIETVELLMEFGWDPNKHSGPFSWLHNAATIGDVVLIEALLKRGFDVDLPNVNGDTALHVALRAGHFLEAAELLIAAGADTTLQGGLGYTLLHSAIEGGSVEAVEALIATGVDPTVTDGLRRTPLSIALEREHDEIVRLLLAAGVTPTDQDLTVVVRQCNRSMLEQLRAAGGDLTALSADGRSLFGDVRMSEDCREVWEYLAANGVDVNAVDNRGWSPLIRAVFDDNVAFTEFLLNHGADPTFKQPDGRTLFESTVHPTLKPARSRDRGVGSSPSADD